MTAADSYCVGVNLPMSAYYSHCVRCERAWTAPFSWWCYPGCPCALFHVQPQAADERTERRRQFRASLRSGTAGDTID